MKINAKLNWSHDQGLDNNSDSSIIFLLCDRKLPL